MVDHVSVTRSDLDHPMALASGAAPADAQPTSASVCYCLATAPRNGSTLLGSAIWATGSLGRPEEYFRPGDHPLWAARWGLDWPSPDGWTAYTRAMVSASTTPNGVAAVKLFPLHLLALPEEVFAEPERQFGAPVKMVHLRRRDKVRAGLSEWKAQMSGQWVRLPGEERTEVPRPPRDSEITKYHEFQHAWDRFWCASRADGVDWIELHYEDVVQDLGAAVQRIANFVGARLDSPAGAAKRTLRQSDPADDQLIERWVQATGGCDECGHV